MSPGPACGFFSWGCSPVFALGLLGEEWAHQPCVGEDGPAHCTPEGCHQPGEASRQRGPFSLRSFWPCKNGRVFSSVAFAHRGGLRTWTCPLHPWILPFWALGKPLIELGGRGPRLWLLQQRRRGPRGQMTHLLETERVTRRWPVILWPSHCGVASDPHSGWSHQGPLSQHWAALDPAGEGLEAQETLGSPEGVKVPSRKEVEEEACQTGRRGCGRGGGLTGAWCPVRALRMALRQACCAGWARAAGVCPQPTICPPDTWLPGVWRSRWLRAPTLTHYQLGSNCSTAPPGELFRSRKIVKFEKGREKTISSSWCENRDGGNERHVMKMQGKWVGERVDGWEGEWMGG